MLQIVFHTAINNYGLLKDEVSNHEEATEPKQYSSYQSSRLHNPSHSYRRTGCRAYRMEAIDAHTRARRSKPRLVHECSLSLQGTEVTKCTVLKKKKLCFLTLQCFCAYILVLRKNSKYFPIQHRQIPFCNADTKAIFYLT